jgi:hypothetical protein
MRLTDLTFVPVILAVLAGMTLSSARGAVVDWAHGCQPFIPLAERHYQLPPGLLEAVALTESGQGGSPYPWAVNIAGQAVPAESYESAARLLRRPDGTPRQDVAIGCLQIHMRYHLANFGDPEWALYPRYNVWYAARLLSGLHRQYGDWVTAIAHYNGSRPAAQRDYLCRVADHLRRTGRVGGTEIGLAACPGHPVAMASPRSLIFAARQVGRIIVLGRDR